MKVTLSQSDLAFCRRYDANKQLSSKRQGNIKHSPFANGPRSVDLGTNSVKHSAESSGNVLRRSMDYMYGIAKRIPKK